MPSKKMKGGIKVGDYYENIEPILYIVGVSLGIGVFLFSMFWYMTAVNSNSFGHLKNIDLSESAQSAYYKELLNEKPLTIKPQK